MAVIVRQFLLLKPRSGRPNMLEIGRAKWLFGAMRCGAIVPRQPLDGAAIRAPRADAKKQEERRIHAKNKAPDCEARWMALL
jgi:hypothetical protein